MANDYFNNTVDILPATRARSSQIEAQLDSVTAGFDKLPSETDIKLGKINYAVDTGAADAYVVALTYTPASYVDGMLVTFKAANANTGASTINVNGLGVKSITRADGSALRASDIAANKIVELRYNSTAGKFEIQRLVAGEMADIATVAGIAANVTTVAGISASVVQCAADTVAINGAAAAAAAAAASESAAAASAAAAATSYDTFDDRYLGSKAADPTLDNDGNALLTGALYWNSTAGNMRAYTGSGWAVAYNPNASSDVQEFTASGTWSKPAGAQFVMVEAWGGGAGGGSGNRGSTTVSSGGGGGGGGCYTQRLFIATELASLVDVTVAAGGTGGAAKEADGTGNAGTVGGNSTFGSYLTAYGGVGGLAGTSTGVGASNGGGALGPSSGYPTFTGTLTTGVYGGGFGSGLVKSVSGTTGQATASGWGGGQGGGNYNGTGITSGYAGGCSFQGGAGGGGGGSLSSSSPLVAGEGGSYSSESGGGGLAGTVVIKHGGDGLTGRHAGGGGYVKATSNHMFTHATYANSTIVFSGTGSGLLKSSTDNAGNFTTYDTYGLPTNAVVYLHDGTKWVAGKSTDGIYTSTDLETWTLVSSELFTWVGYNSGLYVGVGAAGLLKTSTDLVTWTTRTSGTTFQLNHVIHDGTRWIAVGNSNATTRSTDGVTWTFATGAGSTMNNVVSDGSILVAGCSSSPYAVRSTNGGASWVAATTVVGSLTTGKVSYGGGVFVHAAGSVIYTSTDGDTWTLQTDGTTDNYGRPCYDGAYHIVPSSSSSSTVCIRSTDGVTWGSRVAGTFYVAGGNGGSGAAPGGGGGGGAASYAGYTSGAGGNGGNGLVRVYSW